MRARTLGDGLVIVLVGLFLAWNARLFSAELAYLEGEKQERLGQLDAARQQYERAASLLPDRARYHRAAGRVSLDLYRSDPRRRDFRQGSLRFLQQAVSSDPLFPYGWFELGLVLDAFQSAGPGDQPSPEPYFQRALAIDPRNPRFLAGWIDWLLRQGRKDLAREFLPALAASSPAAIKFFGPKLLDREDELETFGRRISGQPAAAAAFASFLVSANRSDQALAWLKLIPEEDWARPEVAKEMAAAYTALGQDREAKQVLDRALAVNPGHWELSIYLARLLGRQKDYYRGIEVLEQAQARTPQASNYSLEMALLAQQAGNDDLAIVYFDQALQFPRVNLKQIKMIHVTKAEIKQKKGDLRGALVEYNRAREIAPEDRDLYYAARRLEVQIEFEQDQRKNGL